MGRRFESGRELITKPLEKSRGFRVFIGLKSRSERGQKRWFVYAAKSGVLFCIYIVYSNVFRFLGNHCCKFFHFLRNHFPFLWEPIWQNKNCLFINRQLYFPLLLWYNDKYPDYIIKKGRNRTFMYFPFLSQN